MVKRKALIIIQQFTAAKYNANKIYATINFGYPGGKIKGQLREKLPFYLMFFGSYK